jgi:hypothetical protein
MERDWLIVTDEEVGEKLNQTHNAFLWVRRHHEGRAATAGGDIHRSLRWQIDARVPFRRASTAEQVYGNTLYVTWFGGGLRAVDFSNPYQPKEVGYYIPNPGKDQKVVMSNDVFQDKDGKLYLMDRL